MVVRFFLRLPLQVAMRSQQEVVRSPLKRVCLVPNKIMARGTSFERANSAFKSRANEAKLEEQ